jgi:hypothetical protein
LSDTSPTIARDAAARVKSFVQTHGRIAVTILVGGISAALGALVPFAHVNGLFGGGESYSIIQSGFYGVVLLAIPILLAFFPIALKQFLHLTLGAFGLSCGMFAIFFSLWLASSGMLSMIGSAVGGLTIGFYLSLLGYGATVVGYYQLQAGAKHA